MRGGMLSVGVVGCIGLMFASGCVSVHDHRRVQAANRTLAAEKESLHQELFDERSVNDNLRNKVVFMERELTSTGELLRNLRSENDLLDETRQMALSTLEDMQGRQTLGELGLPRLPADLDAKLKQFASAHPSEVTYDAVSGTIKWRGDLMFPLGSDDVKPSSASSIASFTDIIKSDAAAEFEVIVAGHTDNTPIGKPATRAKHPTNWHLSSHRAIAVGDTLRQNGYPGERIGVMGCGEYRPIADNATPAGKSSNRRVEIYLVPRGTVLQMASAAGKSAGELATGK
jgi:chemotaxis protein MotB